MKIQKNDQKGFHLVPVLLALVVAGAIGAVGWYVVNQNKDENQNNSSKSAIDDNNAAKQVSLPPYEVWDYVGGEKWGSLEPDPPNCSEPLTIKAPMDVSKATSVLYPGQVRGGDFKPHGGMGVDNSPDNRVDVLMPMDAYLYRASNYVEAGETQYSLDFVHPCGIMMRLGHLAALGPEVQKYITEIPATSDSRTTKFKTNAAIKQGTLIATEVGFRKDKNAFFDFGVYDLRQTNEASKNPAFANEPLRKADQEQSYYALCWFDLLSGKEKTAVKALPSRDGQMGKTSDYCK